MGGVLDGGGDDLGVGQASEARHSTSEISAARFDDGVAALDERRQIGLGGGVLPHVDVHGGGKYHRAGEGEVEGGEKIVRQAVGQLRHQRSEEHTSELQSLRHLVCRLL